MLARPFVLLAVALLCGCGGDFDTAGAKRVWHALVLSQATKPVALSRTKAAFTQGETLKCEHSGKGFTSGMHTSAVAEEQARGTAWLSYTFDLCQSDAEVSLDGRLNRAIHVETRLDEDGNTIVHRVDHFFGALKVAGFKDGTCRIDASRELAGPGQEPRFEGTVCDVAARLVLPDLEPDA